jgi:hypothetical protein
MPVRIEHLGATEHVEVEAVADGGRTVVAGGREFTLRAVNSRFVLRGEPWYGVKLAFD